VLGAEAYGRYAAVLAVVAILQAGSELGLHQVEVRFLSPLWRSADVSEAVALGSSIWVFRLTLSVVAGVAAFLWLGATPAAGQSLAIVAALAALAALRSAQEATCDLFLSIGHVGKLKGFELLQAAARLLAVPSLFLAFGLPGVFAALPVLQALIWALTLVTLLRLFPLRPASYRWPALRPYMRYSLFSFVGKLCTILQVQLGVYAVATWVAAREAGWLAVAMQLYVLMRGLYLAARRSLVPILAELEAAGEVERLRFWGGLALRYAAAATCLVTVAWSALGETAVKTLLGGGFIPVYPAATILFTAVIFFSCAATCNALLYIRNLPGTAALNTIAYTAVILAGLGGALLGDGATQRIAWVYAAASLVFFVTTYVSLGHRGGMWLPLRRTLLLVTPAVLAVPFSLWDAGPGVRVAVLTVFVTGYVVGAVRLGLLPRSEMVEIGRSLVAGARERTHTEDTTWETP